MVAKRLSLLVLIIAGLLLLGGADKANCVPVPNDPACSTDTDCAAGETCMDGECIDICPPVACTLYCEFGFQTGADGCEICACRPDPNYCLTSADCACGVDVETGECAVGNAAYIDPTVQCPDFCTGIDGGLRTACVANRCTLTRARCYTSDDCVQTGCSGQLCAPEPMATDCQWLPEYACYREAYTWCGCFDGACAFAQTAELEACLASPPSP